MATLFKGESWKELSAREKWQIVNGTILIWAAVILYFVSFLMTLSIGMGEISAGTTMLGSGLALFGITSYFKNELTQFETRARQIIEEEEERNTHDTREEDDNREDRQEDDRQ